VVSIKYPKGFVPTVKNKPNRGRNSSSYRAFSRNLSPGQILKFNFDFSSNRLNPDHGRLNRYEVKVTYFDNDMKRQFEDNYILDISSLIGVSLVPEDWDAVVYSLNKIQLALSELARKIV
jgi:hypothetical protein